MFPNQRPTTSGSLNRSRKRTHEPENSPTPDGQAKLRSSTSEASNLVSLFHKLTSFDRKTEKIIVKDILRQEFIDRIGKLYKPVSMVENMNSNSNSCQVPANERRNNHQWSGNNNLLIDMDIEPHFQEEDIPGHCFEELLLPFSNFEDIVMGLAVIYLGDAFSNDESLRRTLCEYINVLSNRTVGNVLFDGDREYESDTFLGSLKTNKRKRRRLTFA